ncbi:MAG: toll/interleukin-1 receptor domain-containing protein [Vicinamibacterales bacterium]
MQTGVPTFLITSSRRRRRYRQNPHRPYTAQRGEHEVKLPTDQDPRTKMPIRLFISHSSSDVELATALIDLFRAALNLPPAAIRCTSVDGYRLPAGAKTEDQLRLEVHESEAFVGIVSNGSVRSLYVLFELGARWGAGRSLIPLLAPGVGYDVLGGPLAGFNALRTDSPAQLHQLVADLGNQLGLGPNNPASYQAQLERVLAIPVPTAHVVTESLPGLGRSMTFDERSELNAVPTDARELLLAAADDASGTVFVTESMQGTAISVGDKDFVTDRLPRTEAKWRRAIQDLQGLGLVENRGGDGSLLYVTNEGFRIADLLRTLR